MAGELACTKIDPRREWQRSGAKTQLFKHRAYTASIICCSVYWARAAGSGYHTTSTPVECGRQISQMTWGDEEEGPT